MHLSTLKLWNFRKYCEGPNGEPGLVVNFHSLRVDRCILTYISITLILPIPHHYPCLHASEFHSFAKRKGLVLLCVGSPTASPTFGDH